MGILSSIRQRIKYFTAKSDARFNERADPKVQLEQAIGEAQDQHRRLKEQAANVIANQKQAELRLNREMGELREADRQHPPGRAHGRAERPRRATRPRRPSTTSPPRRSPTGSSSMEHEIDETKALVLQSSQAAEQAKAAVAQNAQALQKKLAERQKLLSQLDQAKMQEQMNTAMVVAGRGRRRGRPRLRRDPRQDRGPLRQGQGHGRAEHLDGVATACSRSSGQSMNIEAQERLTEIRSQLGHRSGRDDAPASSARAPTPRRRHPWPPRPSSPKRPERGRSRAKPLHRCHPDGEAPEGRLRRPEGRARRLAVAGPRGRRGGRPRPGRRRAGRRCAVRPTPRRPAASRRLRPLANTTPSGPAISTASSASNVAVDADDPGGQQRRAAAQRAPGGPRRRPTTVPVGPDGEGDPQLAGAAGRGRAGSTTVPDARPRRPTASATHVGPGGARR